MRLLLNMNMTRAVGETLAEFGGEYVHARDVGLRTASDPAMVEFARAHGQIIVTHDLDYGDLIVLSTDPRPSAIIFRMRVARPSVMAARIKSAWPYIRIQPFAVTEAEG